MPNIVTRINNEYEQKERRFKVTATDETGTAVGEHGLPHVIFKYATIGPRLNVNVVDLCMDTTGEIKRFLAEKLAEIVDS